MPYPGKEEQFITFLRSSLEKVSYFLTILNFLSIVYRWEARSQTKKHPDMK
jgi:hypothetical protein